MLCDGDVFGVEEGRRGLDLVQLPVTRAAHQPRRRLESAGIEEEFVAGVVGRDDDGVGGVRDARHRRALPAAGCDDLDAAGHVGQCHHQQPVPGPRVVVQRRCARLARTPPAIPLCRRGIRHSRRPAASPRGRWCHRRSNRCAARSTSTRGAATHRRRWVRRCESAPSRAARRARRSRSRWPVPPRFARSPACDPPTRTR